MQLFRPAVSPRNGERNGEQALTHSFPSHYLLGLGVIALLSGALFISGLRQSGFCPPCKVANTHIMKGDPPHDRTVADGTQQAESAKGPMKSVVNRPRFLLFGDSLTERGFAQGGWAAGLADTYMRKVDVVNRGFGGYTSRCALYITDDLLKDATSKNTLLVTIFLGANDAAKPDGPPHSARQHVPLAEFKSNLKKLVASIRAAGLKNIVILGVPPIHDKGRKDWQIKKMGEEAGKKMALDRTLESTKAYADASCEAAKELKIPCVDLYSSMQRVQDWGPRLLVDGLHFTPAGNQHVLEALLDTLAVSYPKIVADQLPLHFPAWDGIDLEDPSKTFNSKGVDLS
mmetsp:Transcript_18832/g.32159  ORF Transcript_18832/g.32159 Transcript_18832/m.32159 type:complete len:344 (-) Transcript_18832:359-1390(-)